MRRKDMQEWFDALDHLPEGVQGVFGECATYTSGRQEVTPRFLTFVCEHSKLGGGQGILGFLAQVHWFELLEDHMKELVAGQNGCNASRHHLWRVALAPTEGLGVSEENTYVENVEWHEAVVE